MSSVSRVDQSLKLVIGNKRFSSWSLRPWLVLEHFQIPFEEILIPLDQHDTTTEILKYTPTARVPVLLVSDDLQIWESLAICEYLSDLHPDKNLWPRDLVARARARTISNEMHAGFAQMRQLLSHDLQKQFAVGEFDWSPALKDVERVKTIWTEALTASGGPFLYGDFSIADAMFAPVVNRFISYGVPVDGLAADYVATLRALPAHQKWIAAGLKETYIAPHH